MYGKPCRGSDFAFPVGASARCALRSTSASRFHPPFMPCTRFRLGSVSSSRPISRRPRRSDISRKDAVTSLARSIGSAPNAGSSYTTRFSRSNPGRGSKRKCTAPISTARPRLALIEAMIRDFKREAPGRRRNNTSRTAIPTAATRHLEEKIFTTPNGPISQELRAPSLDHLQGPLPAGLVKEVDHNLAQEKQPVAPACPAILIFRRLKRPVDKHWPSDDVFLGDESPIAAVEAHAAMIAHREIVAGRNHEILPLNIAR